MDRSIPGRSWTSEISAIFLGVWILLLFAAGWFLKFDPRQDALSYSLIVLLVVTVAYIAVQIRAVVERLGNNSADVATDTIFSVVPLVALLVGAVVKAVLYFIYVQSTAGDMFSGIQWFMSFWTPLEWVVFFDVIALTYIDLGLLTNVMNRITAAARAEGRIAG